MKLKFIFTKQNITRTECTVFVSEISESLQRRYNADQFLEFSVEIKVSRTLSTIGSRSESSYLADFTSRKHIRSLWQSHLRIQCESCICDKYMDMSEDLLEEKEQVMFMWICTKMCGHFSGPNSTTPHILSLRMLGAIDLHVDYIIK